MININEQSENIKELITYALTNKNYELEAIVNNQDNTNSPYDNFVNIIKRIKGKSIFPTMKQKNRLDIIMPDEYAKISRISIEDNNINIFCQNETLQPIKEQIIFENKSRPHKKLKNDEYDIKFNVKEEIRLDATHSDVGKLIESWDAILKAYRRKSTFSFYHESGEFVIDLSIVSQSTTFETVEKVIKNNLIDMVIKPPNIQEPFGEWWKRVKMNSTMLVELNGLKYYKNMRESRIMENTNYRYEIEVEWLGNKKESNQKYNTAEKTQYINNVYNTFIYLLSVIVQGKQQSIFTLSKTEKLNIIRSFTNLTNMPNLRFHPLAVDIEDNNMMKLNTIADYNDKTIINIRMNYYVTDKADGERTLLFIMPNTGQCILIRRDGHLINIGVNIPEYSSSIFDGEFITNDINNNYVRWLYIFDAYVVRGKNITKNIFGLPKDTEGRYFHILNLAAHWKNGEKIKFEQSKYKLQIYAKQYLAGNYNIAGKQVNNDNEIFNSCNAILSKVSVKYGGLLETGHLYSYAVDGLIFQPMGLGVRQNHVGDTVDVIDGRWLANMKWKPPQNNTIDFMVKFMKDPQTNLFVKEYINNNEYIVGMLFVKVYHSTALNRDENMKNLGLRMVNEGLKEEDFPTDYPFTPIFPYYCERGATGNIINKCNLIYIPYKNNTARTEHGDIIENGMTVECLFNLNTKRWTAYKTRPNKQPNAINTVFAAWRLINNPITIEHITGILTPNNENTYYKEGDNFETQTFKKFNNYVKKILIDRVLSGKKNAAVLDLACGQLGDMHKYISNGVNLFVGVEYAIDNLINKNDGAAVRILQSRNEKFQQKAVLIHGDASKNIANGECCFDVQNKYYIDILYGKHKPTANAKLMQLYGVAVNQFNAVICNFAIHYMLDNENQFYSFLQNVKENLKEGGYFLITCQDGSEILKLLKANDDIYTVNVNNKEILRIELENINVSFKNSYYGQKIIYNYETFYKPSVENLVNTEFLISECAKYDLKLVKTRLFNDVSKMDDNMFKTFESDNPEMFKKLNNSEFKEILGFHRWFIFQKVDKFNTEYIVN